MIKMKTLAATALLACSSLFATAPAFAQNSNAEILTTVLERGVLRVGVLGAFRPWAFRAEDGSLQGIEVDLAKRVADSLGVEVELVEITSANRIQFLEQKRIDLIIGGMYDTADRREVVGIIEPGYWASGPSLMAREGAISSWEDVAGKPICAKQGVIYNQLIETRFGARLMAFGGNTEGKEALRSGKCVAWFYDDSSIAADLASGDWAGFEMPVDALFVNPWAAAVPIAEKDGAFGKVLSGLVYGWHEDGTLIDLQAEYDLQETAWLAQMHEDLEYDRSFLGE
ncbi:transporter substrate-binding domain-containing protein [Paracoccus seriniphilus]|uniref:Amino acid ABC transporter substrate-binding protein, PAAT family n=1 Tax=Paracoccus seriniphilus TaxID=184748 RepID=A0A239Q2N7_9RHOB|nr:transporter substrate-binding domain-containing protein [Paracoccus seriniphilus]WCR15934.1 transporter substrate-binding domain-containing protein [Paracoccus seriniphilus]SNT76821.1 amino acid ABC transporter substrate-binding protein, PAAT family [Paracoccus seriniphilus]